MSEIDRIIDGIECERKNTCRRYRKISVSSTVFVLLASLAVVTNAIFSYMKPSWYLSGLSTLAATLDLFVEYYVRRRLHTLEGKSTHLALTRKELSVAQEMKNELEKVTTNEPYSNEIHPAMTVELVALDKAIAYLVSELTYEKSLYETIRYDA